MKLEDYGLEWIRTGHAVNILGWGIDPVTNMKYWIIRNSLGPKFGLYGNFIIERGVNLIGMEHYVTAFDPILCDGSNC